jgi:UPF0716 protein FxsA
MAGVVLLVLLVLPFVELAVFIGAIDLVGFLPTLVAVIVLAALGIWLVKRQGLDVWRRAQTRLRAGEVPSAEVVNGILVLAAGVALAIPGFVSSAVGLALLVPPVRALVRSLLLRRFEQRVEAALAGPVGAVFGGRRLRVDTGPATYDVREVDDRGPGAAGRSGLERPS